MQPSLRQEHKDMTRRRVVTAARQVFLEKGYTRATIEEITAAAGVGRATLYLHFDSKFALITAALEKLRTEGHAAGRRLVPVLASGDRPQLRAWVDEVLHWYVRNRPMALAAQEAELSEEKPTELIRGYLEELEPWVRTWPAERREEARMRFELCRLQMHHYMWGSSHTLFSEALPVDLFTEVWWTTLVLPRVAGGAAAGH
jgi:AcrR family transcriptional regulator